MKPKLSLQTLKTDIAKREATLKTMYSLYPDLTGYSEAELLVYFETQTLEGLYQHIQNIKKSHISHPGTTNLQEHYLCACTNSKGQPKDLYETEVSAQKEAHTLMVHKKSTLSVYPCPNGCGWHLTKR